MQETKLYCNSQELIVMSANPKVAIVTGSSSGIGTDYSFLKACVNNSKALNQSSANQNSKLKAN